MNDLPEKTESFNLNEFFPYQVHAFHLAVSGSLAAIYTERLGITVNEWRTMAVLGSEHTLSASEIVARTGMNKVVVSRAIKGLHNTGFLRRDIDGLDKRRAVLSLTQKGRQAFTTVLPLVRQREKDLLKGFTQDEKQTLLGLMRKVRINTENLAKSV